MMEESLEDKLHQLDLVQIEKVKKLGLRLSAGLKQFDSLTQLVAQVESQSDFQAVGGFVQKENEPPLQEKIEQLEKEQTRALLALKKAVWDTSNALKQDHDKRQILTARHQEHTELEESL
tara:strand:+ start:541 stop:900 length:360 start_codon:yes stop_codon:yes gene_type:complete